MTRIGPKCTGPSNLSNGSSGLTIVPNVKVEHHPELYEYVLLPRLLPTTPVTLVPT